MDFQDALTFKNSLPDYAETSIGIVGRFYVVPQNHNDLFEWLKNFNSDFTDDEAKKYSKNSKYSVYLRSITHS